jgi:hypothetical protein
MLSDTMPHLILLTILQGGHCYDYFADRVTEAQGNEDMNLGLFNSKACVWVNSISLF